METAGLAIAIPGLLALVAKSYLEINRAVEYYRNIDKNLFDTLNRLAAETDTSDSLIKLAQENATYLEDKNLYQAVVRYIECIRSIMGEVSTTLSELNRPPSKLNPIGKKAIPSVASALAVVSIPIYFLNSPKQRLSLGDYYLPKPENRCRIYNASATVVSSSKTEARFL
jgi:hypothetical protein